MKRNIKKDKKIEGEMEGKNHANLQQTNPKQNPTNNKS